MDQHWTVRSLLDWTAEFFGKKGIDEPLLCAQILLSEALGCSRVDLYLRYDTVVDQNRRDVFRELVQRASEGEPIGYLIGHKEFFSLDIRVSPAVLIPRLRQNFSSSG